jgi:trehalose 6-phosphate phosphatase
VKEHSLAHRLWIFDFDGTLSQLVPDRTKATLDTKCKQLLFDLVQNPLNHVAVLSSRTLDDLNPRVPVRGIFLGGGSGTEWRIPGRHRITLGGEGEERLKTARESLMEQLQHIATLPGVDLEDKKWSVALHTRNASISDLDELFRRLDRLQLSAGIQIHHGPDVVEIQLLPEINKAFGVRTLCKLLKFAPDGGRLVYSGDDANDAIAMQWVSSVGGTTITVGTKPLVPGSRIVVDQVSLVREIRLLASSDPGLSRA